MKSTTKANDSLSGGSSLIETIDKSAFTEIGKDVTEMAVDAFLEDGALQSLPIVGWLASITKTGISVRNALFTKKVFKFLAETDTLNPAQRRTALNLLTTEETAENVGEAIIIGLERSDRSAKATILGRLFCKLGRSEISTDEYWQMFNLCDRISYPDLMSLPDYLPKANSPTHGKPRLNYICLSAGFGRIEVMVSGLAFIYDKRLYEILCGCIALNNENKNNRTT